MSRLIVAPGELRAQLIAAGVIGTSRCWPLGIDDRSFDAPTLRLDARGRREAARAMRRGRHVTVDPPEQAESCEAWWTARGRPEPAEWTAPEYDARMLASEPWWISRGRRAAA